MGGRVITSAREYLGGCARSLSTYRWLEPVSRKS